MNSNKIFHVKRIGWKIILTIALFGFVLAGSIEFVNVAINTENWVGNFTLTWGISLFGLMGIFLIGFVWVLAIIWLPERMRRVNSAVVQIRTWFRWSRWPLAGLVAYLPIKVILYSPLGLKFTSLGFRMALFSAAFVIMVVLSTKERGKLINWNGLLIASVILGSSFALGKELTKVVDFPLSLTWSEGNRIWDYSILFGRDRYNYPPELPIRAYIDRGRQTLWGLPFLLPNVSILGVRLWSVFVFTVPYALLGWMSYKYTKETKNQWIILGLWSFLFLNQGPIYTPLILSAMLVEGSRKRPLWIALPLVFLAGRYAQASRFTWMVAPAIWGVLVPLLDPDNPMKNGFNWKGWGRILSFGLAGFLGGLGLKQGWSRILEVITGAFADNSLDSPPIPTENIPMDIGDQVEAISSLGWHTSLSDQPLLFERLLPNPTYELGVLLGLLLAAGPAILFLVYLVKSKQWKLNRLQQLGLFGSLLGFMVVGLMISMKIGGGGDLHNLDMFLITVVIVIAAAWNSIGPQFLSQLDSKHLGVKILLLFIVIVPAFMPWVKAHPQELPPEDKTQWTLELLTSETTRIKNQGGEILFMDQRQLLTFGYLSDIPLVPEYEKKLVMDRAMSGNQAYFQDFYKDISDQRFALIVTDPQRVRFSDDDEDWGAENDTWVQWVTQPLLCYYDPVYTIKKTGVWLLTPKDSLGECSYP